MSWIKRRGQAASPNPSSAPPVRMYNPNQHSNLQGQWQQQDLQPPPINNWYGQPPPTQQKLQPMYPQTQPEPNYWSQPYNQQQPVQTNPPSNYNTQYSQYAPQGYSNENNSYQQKNYINQQPQNSVYNYQESNRTEPQPNNDSWNWGWGDEDNSNVQSVPQTNLNVNTDTPVNAVGFTTKEETWNWSVEDSNTNSNSKNIVDAHSSGLHNTYQNLQNVPDSQSNVFSQMGKLAEKHKSGEISSPDHSRETSKLSSTTEVLPAIPKHAKADQLTPQWSTESQMSQDSSELLHTSESDKSHILSRSSTISESPVSGQDINTENVMPRQDLQLNQEFHGAHIPETSVSEPQNYYRQDNYNLQQENKEDLRSDKKSFKNNTTPPPPPPKNQTPPLGPPTADDNLKNPYKLNKGLPHNSNRYNSDSKSGNYLSMQPKYPTSQSSFNQSVNLETLPDNSEQPDTIPHTFKNNSTKPSSQQWLENNEAPINDRNQYLETGQLSNNDFNQAQLVDNLDSLPPPGFTRMVLGQFEQTDNGLSNQDEPPPGLSRMVLGETGSSSTTTKADEPLHRMIPGGSSSPKPMSRYQSTNYQLPKYSGNGSESENTSSIGNQIRSATIGADTQTNLSGPSVAITNRSKTIGADISLPYNSSNSDNIKANSHALGAPSNFNNNVRETNVDGANNLDENITQPVNTRRDSIEGEPQENSLSNLVNSIRDLTVGESLSNNSNPTLAVPERTTRRPSKQESSDSEGDQENVHLTRDRKDRRYYDKHDDYERDRGRSRYTPSPDHYRDKKYEKMRYRDKRYDDDTDYYSDKERDRRRDDRDRREELDRKYSSLKRDKDKERRRREPRGHRDYVRDGRRDYYHRYDDEYDDASRPSSRSDSMHDSYRQERDRRRERDVHRRHRDPYNPYMQGYGYDPYNPYYQQYQYHYFENLRRTNPQAYAEWYRKYYQQASTQQNYGNEDRASVHSGRSSANDELTKDRYTRQSFYSQSSLNYYREPHSHSILGHYAPEDIRNYDQTDSSLYLDETTAASQRLTPPKFASAHVKASISSGRFVKILPHYLLDGQSGLVEITNLGDVLMNNDDYKELVDFPGPLIKGVTHKKTIIEYCENKIRSAIYNRDIGDVDSYVLMWELLILLLRQNGMVVGTDIAELLMKGKKQPASRKDSVTSNSSGIMEASPLIDISNIPSSDIHSSSTSVIKDENITNKFRDYLIYGSEKEALEWAMKHGLWGHALFLASKLDKRTYANVMTRFANGLTMNDPLQTLYQLLSGKLPAAVTCVADEKWGDWRPHLAMILSNTSQRPELDRKAITTLGDTLFNRGSLYAAHFCYLMAQVGFSRFGAESAKLVLLGANHNKPFVEFAVNEAIHMTEVYEYACSLNDDNFVIPEFLTYKYILATRLADNGLLEKALAYLEKISLAILHNSSIAQQSLIHQIAVLADRLKYYDLVDDAYEGDGEYVDNRPDNSWLKELKILEKHYDSGALNQDNVENFETNNVELEQNQLNEIPYEQPSWSQQNVQYQQQWQSVQYEQQTLDYQQNQASESYNSDLNKEQQSYWSSQQTVDNVEQIGIDSSSQYLPNDVPTQNDYWNNASAQPQEVETQLKEDLHQPQISLPNQSNAHTTFDESHRKEIQKQAIKKDSPSKQKPQEKAATTGWFGGIWNKLSLRPKNQMKLPDDKNPTIVWDEQKKRWINLDADGDGAAAELKPPPKMSDMYSAPTLSQPAIPPQQDNFHNVNNMLPRTDDSVMTNPAHAMMPNQNPLAMPHMQNQQVSNFEKTAPNEEHLMQPKSMQPNMFKLQRNRNIKKSYVDVFNPGAKSSGVTPPQPASDTFATLPNNGVQMNYFVPAPITDPNAPTDFLTPAPMPLHDNNAQISRSSSASSLSREVQFYMQHKEPLHR